MRNLECGIFYLKKFEILRNAIKLISNTINTTHLAISEDRKLLHTFKSDFYTFTICKIIFFGYVAATYSKCRCVYRKNVCVCYQEV